jgi:hypothetical protein
MIAEVCRYGLIGTTDLENVHNELRFRIEHKEHYFRLLRTKYAATNPIIGPLWHRLIRSAAAARKIYGRISTGGTSMDMATPFPALKSDQHVRFWH